MAEIYQFNDFRRFVLSQVTRHSGVRGYQGKLAHAARCQPSYFSRMINGKATLNGDQAMGLALFWQLDEKETDYLLLLLELEHTQFGPMKSRIRAKLERIRAPAPDLADRFNTAGLPDSHAAETYYSAWQWMAIHLITGISRYRTSQAIAGRLNLPAEHVESVLGKLAEMKLMDRGPTGWKLPDGHTHLPKTSALTTINHLNWRQKALTDVSTQRKDSLHYTSVQTHSTEDFYKIRDVFLESIDRSRNLVAPSKNEELSCICIDFFPVS